MACIDCDNLRYRSEEQISLDTWHELRVSRTAKSGILQVDSQRPIEGIAEVICLKLHYVVYGHKGAEKLHDKLTNWTFANDSILQAVQVIIEGWGDLNIQQEEKSM